MLFCVTYEVLGADGEKITDGCQESDLRLRDAVEEVTSTRTRWVDGVESVSTDSCLAVKVRWVTVTNSPEFRSGEHEVRSLHIPPGVSDASSRRIARLLGARV